MNDPIVLATQVNDASFGHIVDELKWRGLVALSTDEQELRAALDGQITYYCGFDPTAPSLHLGNLVQLLTMRRLQLAELAISHAGRRLKGHGLDEGISTRLIVYAATLIGHGPTVMNSISMIGNEFAMDDGVGTCGKSGQSVPVGVGQPSLRIDSITVGGAGG